MVNETIVRQLAKATLERAQALWNMGKREQAMRDFQEAYSSAPDLASIPYSKAVYQIGTEKQETGDLEGALTEFKTAIEIAPDGEWKAEIQQAIKSLVLKLHPPETKSILITKCPQCGEPVQPDWSFCPNCTTDLRSIILMEAETCPQCGKKIIKDWEYCPFCTAILKPKTHLNAVENGEVAKTKSEAGKPFLTRDLVTQTTNKGIENKKEITNRNVDWFTLFVGGFILLCGLFIYINDPKSKWWFYALVAGGLTLLRGISVSSNPSPKSDEEFTPTTIHSCPISEYLSKSESLALSGDVLKAAQILEEAIADEPLASSIVAGDPDDKPPRGYALLLQLAAESGNRTLALRCYNRMLDLNPHMPENAKKAAKKAGIL